MERLEYRTAHGRWYTRSLFLLLSIVCAPISLTAAAPPPHVIVISIDGLRPDYYLQPDTYRLKIPHLRSLLHQGSYAQGMVGVYPTLTYPSHTTIVTGVRPAWHGIVANFVFAPAEGLPKWYLRAADIQTKTLWDAAKDKGLKTAVVTWPVTYGARVDYLIPENLAITSNIADLIRQGATPGLFAELEKRFGPVTLLPFTDPQACLPLDRMTTDFAAQIVKSHQPQLLLLHLLDLDHQQHGTGLDTPQVFASFEHIDALIGNVIAAVRQAGLLEKTTFIIVGDHGFARVHASLNFNALLVENGFLTVEDSGKVKEWAAFVQGNGGSAAVYIKDRTNAAVRTQVEQLFRTAIAARYTGIVRIVDREELDQLGAFPDAAFALEAAEGYYFTPANPQSPVLNPADPFKGMHGYLPTTPQMRTGFIASGSGIRQGVVLPSVRMLDVAPTVAALLRLDLPTAEGVPLVDLLSPQ